MAKLGITKNTKARMKLENHPSLVDNLAGGKGYSINDPATTLITMIGSGFFNEPRYYDQKTKTLLLTEQAEKIISTAIAVAKSDNPQDFWVISQWAREELNIRTTPNVLAALGAYMEETKRWARAYIPRITQRADEPLQVFAAYLALNDGAPLTNSLRRGLSDSIAKFDEWQMIRYSTKIGSPNTKDMLLMIDRKRNWPLSKELFEYIVNDKVVDPKATPIAAAKSELSKKGKVFDSEAKRLILESRSPWEVVISQFGSHKEVWEFLIMNNLMGYMALLRNLRNFESVNISEGSQRKVYEKLTSEAEKSKQLPFRFLSARKNVTSNWAASAIDTALEESIKNIPLLPGKTAVVIDTSNSMTWTKVSQRSEMNCSDVANVLGAAIAKKYGAMNTTLYAFATDFDKVQFSDADSTMSIAKQIEKAGLPLGGATYAYKPFQNMIIAGERYDRIIILSDMQCYLEDDLYGWGEGVVGVDKAITEYQERINPNVFVHSIDIAGYSTAQVDPRNPRVNLLGGWSDNIFKLLESFEGIEDKSTPNIEELRKKYGIK